MRCPKELVIIPGATHLFEEPGTLEEVARLAKEWFKRYLRPTADLSRARQDPGARYPRKDMDEQC
jgi:putative phosphoribosyl transferase